jgi:hypothetical protein
MKLYLVNGSSIISRPLNTDYLLQTFYELNSKRIEAEVAEFIENKGVDNFILDSGAFSLFNGIKKLSYNDLKLYIDKYCDYINKYEIKQFVEMDIDSVIGYEEVKKINKYIESRVGRKPMYVYHIERGKADLEIACKENDYIMWGGIAKARVEEEVVNSFVDYCYDFGTKVHLLGYTPMELDKVKNLYSCDSSSWTMGGRAGNIFQFTNNRMDSFKVDEKKRVSFYQLNNHNLNQWIKYQHYLKDKGWIIN